MEHSEFISAVHEMVFFPAGKRSELVVKSTIRHRHKGTNANSRFFSNYTAYRKKDTLRLS